MCVCRRRLEEVKDPDGDGKLEMELIWCMCVHGSISTNDCDVGES